uniref:Uncharacterized protein n=1 Tax=Ignisphaera aggregans TaxID=334771 RepID=A0A7J2U6R5_9CREN
MLIESALELLVVLRNLVNISVLLKVLKLVELVMAVIIAEKGSRELCIGYVKSECWAEKPWRKPVINFSPDLRGC